MFYTGKLEIVDHDFRGKRRGRTPKKLVRDEEGDYHVLKCRDGSEVSNISSVTTERLAYTISEHLSINVPEVLLINSPSKYGFNSLSQRYGCLVRFIDGLIEERIFTVEKKLSEVFDLIMNSISQSTTLEKTEEGDVYFIDNEHAIPWSDRMLSHIDGVLSWLSETNKVTKVAQEFSRLSDDQIDKIIGGSFCEDLANRKSKTRYWLKSLRDIFKAGEWNYEAWVNRRTRRR